MIKESSSAHISRIAREYSLYVLNGGRAIPSIYDGLKMSQRIALWTLMNDTLKTASLAGRMIESGLYVHGDASAENAISAMAAPLLNNNPYLDGIGAFGTKVDPYGFSAARYTSVKRSEFAKNNLFVDKDILPMVENYDGSSSLPLTFFPLLPLVLLNGVSGIAIGYATEIFPRSFQQIKKATLEYIKTGNIKTDLSPHYGSYDVSVTKIEKNKYRVAGKVVKLGPKRWRVVEILPGMNLVKLRERLIDLMEDKIDEKTGNITTASIVDDFEDNSQKKIDIEVSFKVELSEEQVLKKLELVTIQSENIVVLDIDGVKQIDSPQDVIRQFVDWRIVQYKNRYRKMIEDETREELFWKSFLACLRGGKKIPAIPLSLTKYRGKSDLKEAMSSLIHDELKDEMQAALKLFADAEKEALKGLMKAEIKAGAPKILTEHRIPVDADIVERLSVLPVYRWTKTGIEECETKIKESRDRMKVYREIMKSPEKQKQIYVDEVTQL